MLTSVVESLYASEHTVTVPPQELSGLQHELTHPPGSKELPHHGETQFTHHDSRSQNYTGTPDITDTELTVERMKHLFRNCHAIDKKGRPYTDYVWICLLDKLESIDIGTTYLNDKAASVFIIWHRWSEKSLWNLLMCHCSSR